MLIILKLLCHYVFSPYVEAAARETLEQVMADALSKSGSNRSAVRAVCLAVSGVNHPTDQQRILNWLRYYLCFCTDAYYVYIFIFFNEIRTTYIGFSKSSM